MKEPRMIVLNMTSWAGISIGAEHIYGKMILVSPQWKDINFENIEEWGINTFGEEIKLRKELSLKECKVLDKKDSGYGLNLHSMEREFKLGAKPKSDRFNTIEEIVEHGVKFWLDYCKEHNCDVPFIALYEGDKLKPDSVEYQSVKEYNNIN